MKSSNRGQATGFPMPLVLGVVVVVAIYVGQSLLESFSAIHVLSFYFAFILLLVFGQWYRIWKGRGVEGEV